MRTIRSHLTRWGAGALFVIAVGMFVSAPRALDAQSNKKASKSATRPSTTALAWPLPPEQPRIRYLATYRGLDDFKPAKKPSQN